MAPALSVCAIWEEIERSESYLVCSMFEEAASTSSSVLKCLYDTDFTDSIEEFQLDDVVESAGMVLVQSLKELGRTSEMLKELKLFFSSVAAIPVQVVLTGACFQISEGSVSGLKEFLEEFLGKWRYVNGEYHVLSSIDQSGANLERCQHRVLGVEQYLELVEVYAMTLLGTVLNDMGLAISWVEKAELPEGKKQEFIRRLRSLYSLTSTNSSCSVETPLLAERNNACASSKESTISGFEGSSRTSKAGIPSSGEINTKQATSKLSKQIGLCLWWFRNITLKIRNAQLVISHGKLVLWVSFIVFIYYVLRKRQATLKGFVSRQALIVKKALVDMWKLAFSVQVNPLAAVQPLPTTAHRSR